MAAWEERLLAMIAARDPELVDRLLCALVVRMQQDGRGW